MATQLLNPIDFTQYNLEAGDTKRAKIGHINYVINALNTAFTAGSSDIVMDGTKLKSVDGTAFVEISNGNLKIESGYIGIKPTSFFVIEDPNGTNRITLAPGANKFSYSGTHEFTGITSILSGLRVNTINSVNGTQLISTSATALNIQAGSNNINVSTTAITMAAAQIDIVNVPVVSTAPTVYVKNASGHLAEITIADLKILLA